MSGSSNHVARAHQASLIAYEKINEKYYKAKYLGLECVINTQTGYINATKFYISAKSLSAVRPGKNMINYLKSDGYKELVALYPKEAEPVEPVIKETTGDYELRGTYFEPELLLHFAMWVSAAAYNRAMTIVKNNIIADLRQGNEDVEDEEDEAFLLGTDELGSTDEWCCSSCYLNKAKDKEDADAKLATLMCAMCGCTNKRTKRCAQCRNTRYCSNTCQASHWSTHKQTCVDVGTK